MRHPLCQPLGINDATSYFLPLEERRYAYYRPLLYNWTDERVDKLLAEAKRKGDLACASPLLHGQEWYARPSV